MQLLQAEGRSPNERQEPSGKGRAANHSCCSLVHHHGAVRSQVAHGCAQWGEGRVSGEVLWKGNMGGCWELNRAGRQGAMAAGDNRLLLVGSTLAATLGLRRTAFSMDLHLAVQRGAGIGQLIDGHRVAPAMKVAEQVAATTTLLELVLSRQKGRAAAGL